MPDKDDPTKLIENPNLCASDYIKVEFRVEYDEMPKEDMEGYVVSRNYPYLKRHGWTMLLVDTKTGERVHLNVHKHRYEDKYAKPGGKEDDFKAWDGSVYHINRQRIGQVGQFDFTCHFISDSYVGFDSVVPLQIKTSADPTDIEEFQYTTEDKNAAKAPGGMAALFAEEEDGFTASEDEEEDVKGMSQTDKLKRRLEEANLGGALSGRKGAGVAGPRDSTKKQ